MPIWHIIIHLVMLTLGTDTLSGQQYDCIPTGEQLNDAVSTCTAHV